VAEMLTDYEVKPKTHYIHGQWPPQWQPDSLTTQENTDTREYMYGNRALPVALYRKHILDTIQDNQFTIIRSATGSGKTTQVPQYLYEEGFGVIVTQPRIMAARTNSERIREELEDIAGPTGDLVGYRTKEEGDSTRETKILLCTDGLQVMHELTSKPMGKKTVLVLDEIHERNHNMDLLLALAKKRAKIDPDFRVVIMSATVDVERYAEFLQIEDDKPVPVIDIPGQTFEVSEVEGGDAYDEAIKYGQMGLNVAIIVPGKEDIRNAIAKIAAQMPKGHTILPLHRDQTVEEQQRVMASYPGGKIIVATNVLRSSITVPDLDVMIGCGWERTSETNQDVSGTYIRPTSLSSEDQERGRVGRTKPGIYVRAHLAGYPPLPSREERALYDTPEINRMRLDGTILKLARVAIGIEDLEFMSDLYPEAIKGAKTRLRKIGALAVDGTITEIGKDMAFLPIDPHHARMLVESRSQSYRVRQQLLAAIAVQQENGITVTEADQARRWKKLSSETQSDVLMNLDVFIAALDMKTSELYKSGIIPKKFYRALEAFNALSENEGLTGMPIEKPDDTQREALMHCIVAGSDELYQHLGRNSFIDPRKRRRKISMRSAMARSQKELIMGTPFDLQKMTERGGRMRKFILGATAVTASLLIEASPERVKFDELEYTIDKDGFAKIRKAVYFDGIDLQNEVLATPEPSPELKEFLIRTLVDSTHKQLHYNKTKKMQQTFIRLRELQKRSVKSIDVDIVKSLIVEELSYYIPDTVRTLGEVDAYMPDYTVDMFVPAELEAEILKSSPSHITIKGVKLYVKYEYGNAYIDIPKKLTRSVPDTIPELGNRPVYIHNPRIKGYHLLQDTNVVSIVSPAQQRRKKEEPTKLQAPFFAQSPATHGAESRKLATIPQQRQPFHSGGFNRASTGRR
jgi:HrpA-like RNA helicase